MYVMTSRLLTLLHNKIAAAVVGVLLVGGSGAAVVASHGQLPFTHSATSATATHTPDAHASDSSHAHTVSINGKLTAYAAAAKTIAVRETGATSATTISVDGNTRVDGEHANSLADLTNAVGHDVQVQAGKQSDSTLLAWKITVQGDDSGHGNGNGNGNSGQHQISGTIASTGTDSLVVKLADGTTKTVTISASTQFAGTARGFKDLKQGMRVSIQGSDQSDGTFAATRIEATGA